MVLKYFNLHFIFPDTRELSSTDDLSSRPHSPSVSSSDESYSKTTEGEGDSPLPGASAASKPTNPLQWLYPGERLPVDATAIGGPKLSPIDLKYLQDFEINSSTTDCHTMSTLPHLKGESCKSFEYHDRALPPPSAAPALMAAKSPFEREIQRLLAASRGGGAAKEPVTREPNHLEITASNIVNGSGSRFHGAASGGRGNAKLKYELESVEKPRNHHLLEKHHPVGLEAIKEITRNKHASESSHLQTSDTESCEILNDAAQHPHLKKKLSSHTNNTDDDVVDLAKSENGIDDLEEMNYITDELKYGAGHQSIDSNPMESQSEWSDDECREEATGGAESTGYITDEPGLENVSLLNEAGLTDAEGALSDVNSIYNVPDVDDTSLSSRASSRLLSLDSLSGLYDCELDSKHELAIVTASNKITTKFGPQN
jgi:hypothetical protein